MTKVLCVCVCVCVCARVHVCMCVCVCVCVRDRQSVLQCMYVSTQAATQRQHNVCVVKVFHTLCATFSAGYEHGEKPTDKMKMS